MISVSLVACFISLFLVLGCGVTEIPPPKTAPQSLITTPASYYSTPRARYLGGKYKDNLDRLVNRISRNPKTSKLQLANNISGIGGIGFFTHSAAKTPDERYLEVILGAPETFDTRDNYSAKVARLFSLYGMELLSVLSSDLEISQEKELSGYGLNFSWRNIAAESPGARVSLQRVVTYMSKDNVREFLKREIDQDKLLKEAVIFAVEEDGPMNLISFRPQEIIHDFRLPIREESLAVSKIGTQPVPQVSSSQSLVTDVNQSSKLGKGIENLQNEEIAVKETWQKKQEAEASAPTANKSIPEVSRALQKPAVEIKKLEAAGAAPKSNRAPSVSPLPYDNELMNSEKTSEAKSETVVSAPEADVRTSDANFADQVTARQKPPEAGNQPLNVEAKKTTEPIRTERKVQVKSGATTPAPEVDPSAGERLALTRNMPVKKSMTLSKPKALEGYVIQVAFADRPTAERWAETLEHRGYVVSVTETGSAESLRVRIGNFALRDDAESQLRKLRQEGLTGMIVNLPRAYRPGVSTPQAGGSVREDSVSQ
jgi:cell division protein FtsN